MHTISPYLSTYLTKDAPTNEGMWIYNQTIVDYIETVLRTGNENRPNRCSQRRIPLLSHCECCLIASPATVRAQHAASRVVKSSSGSWSNLPTSSPRNCAKLKVSL